jgi:predicted CDP-diglyceride synthetase/phosphatidate cytidylyltransferase
LLASIPLPVALAHFAAEDKFAAAFRFREWWRVLRANPLGFLIAWVVVVGLIGIVYFLSLTAYFTLVLICLLPFLLLPACFYVVLVGASLFGDLYAQGRAQSQ